MSQLTSARLGREGVRMAALDQRPGHLQMGRDSRLSVDGQRWLLTATVYAKDGIRE